MICPACQAPNDEGAEACFTCGKNLGVAPAPITRGLVIAERYEVVSPLGRGGMGMVYKAHDRVLDETVAVKTLRADVASEAESARRFRSEIKLARKVRHRNVCAIHEYGEAGGLRFIAMEFIDGVDLRRQIRERGALPEPEAFDVAIQAASGLQAIHNAGIIHRDLKSSNIMRDGTGRVRLMDFGIAKQFGVESTLGGRVVGTPEYMSPEQARGHKLDFRSDLYALGIVVYEVFTGRVPFQGETPIATILMHLNDSPSLEGPGAERIPAPLAPVLRRALAKAREDRFSTARELTEALERARAASRAATGSNAQEPASAVPPAAGETGRGRFRANRWFLAVAGVPLAGALALIATQRVGPRPTPPVSSSVPPAPAAPQPALPAPVSASEPPPRVPEPAPSPPPTPIRPPIDKLKASAAAPPPLAATPLAALALPTPGPTGLSASAAPGPAPTTSAAAPGPSFTPSAPAPRRATPPPTRRGALVETGPGVTPPLLVKQAEPVYPVLARRLKRRARVLIRALVDEHGKVVEAVVAEGDASRLGFDEAALGAAYRMLYEPATKDGVPVQMWIELPVTFKP